MKPDRRFHAVRRLRSENWRALGLLLATFAVVMLGVGAAVSGLDAGLLWPPLLLGLVLGWTLAASSVSARWMALLTLALGPLAVLTQVGNLSRPLIALIRSLAHFGWLAVSRGAWPGTNALRDHYTELLTAVGALGQRLAGWLLALGRGEPRFDPVAVAVLWLLALLAVAVWAAWAVRRRGQPMLGLLPALLLLAAMLTASSASAFSLAPALALTLILKASLAHRRQEQRWQEEGLAYSARFGRNATWAAAGLALSLLLLALLTPSISIYRLMDLARDLSQQQRDQEVARSFGLEAAEAPRPADPFAQQRSSGLPARQLIGSGPELSQQPVMAITIEESPELGEALRYWRGVTYDTYTGRGWRSRGTATVRYRAGETAGRHPAEQRLNQRLVRQAVRRLDNQGSLIYTGGSLLTVDQDFQVAWRTRFLDTEQYTDFFAAALISGQRDTYRADSLVPVFSGADLRAARPDLPDWIIDQYLGLPDNVSDRVRSLARDLTATEPTAYDRALAIERYLRRFPYTLELPAPPAGREIADYFLFELQRGYCDYYATTMIVLARAAGLPARLATGYIGGAFDPENSSYLVTADLAHSWPEIYFSDYGWIPFEPTAGREIIDRPAALQSQAAPLEDGTLEPITAERSRFRWNLALRVGASGLLAVFVGALLWWLLDLWRLRLLEPEPAVRRLFAQLSHSSRGLDVRPRPGETAHEFAQRLDRQLAMLAKTKRSAAWLASAPPSIAWLIDLYNRTLYSPHQTNAELQARAVRTWWRLRLQLLWAALLVRGERLIGQIK
ncbi:MAG: transglutaminase domain-containing protein [Candidatus Promineifilaceae bacterium]|nr:transglutaminase domain-containing protein [Candidatus Promineifilaceae bacterium]